MSIKHVLVMHVVKFPWAKAKPDLNLCAQVRPRLSLLIHCAGPMSDEVADSKVYANFGKYNEFSKIQADLLALDPNVDPTPEEEMKEARLLGTLLAIVSSSLSCLD